MVLTNVTSEGVGRRKLGSTERAAEGLGRDDAVDLGEEGAQLFRGLELEERLLGDGPVLVARQFRDVLPESGFDDGVGLLLGKVGGSCGTLGAGGRGTGRAMSLGS